MFINALKKLLPPKVKVFLSGIEDFLRFDLYAYRILSPRIKRLLQQRKRPSQYLFILAPARSGSSLLINVLNSHSQISGYGESHKSYVEIADLEKLIYRTAAVLDDFDPIGHTYVTDKIVWNYRLSDKILQNKNIKFIFLLRDPMAIFMSALKCSSVPEFQDVDRWMHYYQKRLTGLAKIATEINDPSRCLTLNYENLLDSTDQVLASFQQFLGTTLPFSDNYRAPKNGRFKYGDSSKAITSGTILRKQIRPLQVDNSIVSLEKQRLVAELQRSCMQTLSMHTQNALGVGSARPMKRTQTSTVKVEV